MMNSNQVNLEIVNTIPADIENIREGDIVEATSEILPNLIHHWGIIILKNGKRYVLHNSTPKYNEFGGSIRVNSLQTFFSKRKLIRIERTNLNTTQIIKISDNLKKKKFNWFMFNCQEFIKTIKCNYGLKGIEKPNHDIKRKQIGTHDVKTNMLKFVKELEKNKIRNFSFHTSRTAFGNSNYFIFLGKDLIPIMKVRISDHSVTNPNRISDEIHFFGQNDQLKTIIKVAKSYESDYLSYFKEKKGFKLDLPNYKAIIEKSRVLELKDLKHKIISPKKQKQLTGYIAQKFATADKQPVKAKGKRMKPKNIINRLKNKFQSEIKNFGITEVFEVDGEIHITSNSDVKPDLAELIEKEAHLILHPKSKKPKKMAKSKKASPGKKRSPKAIKKKTTKPKFNKGSLVKVAKYGWIMKVMRNEFKDNKYLVHLENSNRGTNNGNVGSYLEKDLRLVLVDAKNVSATKKAVPKVAKKVGEIKDSEGKVIATDKRVFTLITDARKQAKKLVLKMYSMPDGVHIWVGDKFANARKMAKKYRPKLRLNVKSLAGLGDCKSEDIINHFITLFDNQPLKFADVEAMLFAIKRVENKTDSDRLLQETLTKIISTMTDKEVDDIQITDKTEVIQKLLSIYEPVEVPDEKK